VVVDVVDELVLVLDVLAVDDVEAGTVDVVVTTGHEVVVVELDEPELHATSAIGTTSTRARG
jgi:hypothetical protein